MRAANKVPLVGVLVILKVSLSHRVHFAMLMCESDQHSMCLDVNVYMCCTCLMFSYRVCVCLRLPRPAHLTAAWYVVVHEYP